MRDSVNAIACLRETINVLTPSVGVLIRYAGFRAGCEATAHDFLERLGTGLGLTADSPIYQLRKFLLSLKNPSLSKRRPDKLLITSLPPLAPRYKRVRTHSGRNHIGAAKRPGAIYYG